MKKICPRCEESRPAEDFRGSVCGFCADVLEALDEADNPQRREP
jgi:hypothetical protein